MSIDNTTVKNIAFLSRIAVSDEEVPLIAKELSKIVDWIEQLFAVDVEKVEPMVSVVQMALRRRPDEVTDGDLADGILLNAPETDDNCFLVPKVVE